MRHRKNRLIIIAMLITSFLLVACSQATATPALPKAEKPPATDARRGASEKSKPSWQEEWETTLAAARREGRVTVMVTYAPTIRNGVAEAFKARHGLEIEYLAGNINEILPKMEAERRSGIYAQDVIMSGLSGLTPIVKDLDSFDPMLLLPEVKDIKAWRGEQPPFYDPEHKLLMFLSRVGPTAVVNTETAKPDLLKSWRNLLEPRWKGNIMLFDPSIPGAGNYLMVVVREIMGVDYLKELAKQELVMMRDKRMNLEWVAKNKYPIALAADLSLMEEMRAAGAPLAHVVPTEGTHFGSGIGAMAVVSNAAHPNASKVFINWFLSREGQTLFGKVAKEPSRRSDVTPDMPPDRVFQKGIKYVDFDTAHMLGQVSEMYKLSKEIFAVSYK